MAKIDPETLDHCLRRIQTGRATVDECVSENFDQAETLESLLQLAAATRSQLAVEGPSQAFLTHSPKRVLNVVSARQQTAAPLRRPRFAWRRQPAFRLAGALVALVLLLGTAGVASASTEALPGDSLYGVKRGLERAALAISLSPAGDAELLLEQANRRIAEVEELVHRGRGGDIGPALEGYEHAVQLGLAIAAEHGTPLGDLELALGNHVQALDGALAEAPAQAVPGLTRALENSRNSKEKIEQIRSGQHPDDLAPGQLKRTPDPLEDDSDLSPGQQKKDEAGGRDQAPGQIRKTQTSDSNGSD